MSVLANGVIVEGHRIEGVIGQGGMGVVYEATDLFFDRTVALKLITAQLSKDSSFRERFRREGIIQAGISHPHIVTVYKGGESEHGLFLAMQLVRGPNLKDLIAAGEVDERRTLRLLTQVGDALDTAHEAGLIHRDIKPNNILVDVRRNCAYLADFGVTKARDMTQLTGTGQLVGTLDYISPEQILGRGASERSDVYALGAVLFECLTGRVPFNRDSDVAVMYAHLSDPPPAVTEERADLPTALDDVIHKAMAKEPEERYGTAVEMMAEAERALGPLLSVTLAPAPVAPSETPTGIEDVAQPVETFVPGADATGATRAEDTAIRTEPDTDVRDVEEVAVPSEPPVEPTVVAPIAAVPSAPTEDVSIVSATPPPGPPPAPEVPAEAEDDGAATGVQETELARPALTALSRPEQPTAAGADPTAVAARGLPAVSAPAPPAPSGMTAVARSDEVERDEAARARPPVAAPSGARPRGGTIAAIAAALLVIVAAGAVAGRASSGSEEAAPAPPTPLPTTARAGGLALTVPPDWKRAALEDKVPGLNPAQPIGLARAGLEGAGGLIAGRIAPAWPTFLPAEFRERLTSQALARQETIKLGSHEGFRYQRLQPKGFDGLVTVYVVPQATGTRVIACFARKLAQKQLLGECERIAASVSVAGSNAYPLEPTRQYASTLNRTITQFESGRKRALRKLRSAETRAGQAQAATTLSTSCGAGLKRLRSAEPTPFERPAHERIVKSLRETCGAYARLAKAARPPGDRGGYDRARRTVTTNEAQLQARLESLRQLGFRI